MPLQETLPVPVAHRGRDELSRIRPAETALYAALASPGWRTKPLFTSLLRGINAAAVGLVFTAVYRLWGIGYLTPESVNGKSLAENPWWVVVTALAYAESAWFSVPPAVAIMVGAVLGLAWFGAVGS